MTDAKFAVLKSGIWAKCIAATGAFFATLGVNLYYFEGKMQYSGSFLNLLLFAVFFLLFHKALQITDKMLHRLSLTYSVLLSLGMTYGKAIWLTNDAYHIFHEGKTFGQYLFVFLGLLVLFYYGMKFVLAKVSGRSLALDKWERTWFLSDKKRSLFLSWGIIFASWVPCYLAYYPGIYSYDIMGQTYQALGMTAFNRFQAIGHTFFVTLCYKVGDLFGGPVDADPAFRDGTAQLVAYAIIQMLLMAFAFAFAVWYLSKRRVHFALRLTALLCFALNPLNAIFSFTPTKDVLFTAYFLFLIILLAELIRDPDRFLRSLPMQILLILDLILICLFRNNALYALILFFPFLVFVYRKKCGWRILRTAVLFLLSYLILSGPVLTALGVKEGNVKEALSVPIQQIACTVKFKGDELTDQERNTINEILPYDTLEDAYNPRFTDPVKDDFNAENFTADPVRYAKLWGSLFIQYPQEFLSAFLTLNVDYWYPDAEFPDQYSQRMYIETYINQHDALPLERDSKLPGLYDFYEAFADGQMMQKIPVVSVFFSISTPIWLMGLCMVILWAKKKPKLILIFLPAVLMWLTFIAGPVSNLRYIYPIIAAYPLYLSLIASPDGFLPQSEE